MASPVKRVVDDIETADEVPQNKMEQEATEVIEYGAPPPEELTCSICLQVLCDPTLTSCCGQHFCRGCIDRVMARGHVCPLCNEKGFQTMLNKEKHRKVRELKVYCKLKAQGCGWVGELGALERHLDVADGNCGFVEVDCEFGVIGCVGKMPRKDRESHSRECMHKHLLLMTRWSLKTIDGFQEKSREQRAQLKEAMARQDVRKQLEQQRLQFKEELEQQRVQFKEELEQQRVQFEEKLEKQHVQIKSQMELQQSEYEKISTQQSSDFAAKLEKVSLEEKQIAEHKKIIEKKWLTSIPPPEITMTNFAAHKKDNDNWYSPPFFSHPGGYKMCLRVHSNGICPGEGTHVSVYVHLMQGELDDQLQWPFRGDITVQLLNQRGDGEMGHAIETIRYNDSTPDTAAGRVVGSERAETGYGYGKFTPHYDLAYNATKNTEYLVNDCLRFRVSNIKLTHPASIRLTPAGVQLIIRI